MSATHGVALVLGLAAGIGVVCQTARAQEVPPGTALPVQVARMYPRETGSVWTEVLKVLQQAGVEIEVIDRDGRFLVTNPVDVEPKYFGFAINALGNTLESGRVTLHVFVPPFIEPARVYVGSILEAVSTQTVAGSPLSVTTRLYGATAFGTWLFDKLSARLGSPGEPIPQGAVARAKLARSLTPGKPDPCLARIEADGPHDGHVEPPKKIHDEAPMYPGTAHARGQQRVLVLEASLLEDGFSWPTRIVSGATVDEDFSTAAIGAVGLWRYRPARVSGCPTPSVMTVTVAFSLQ